MECQTEDKQRRVIIENIENGLASSRHHRQLIQYLDTRKPIRVSPQPDEIIAYMRTEPNQCHLNCYLYERAAPKGYAKWVKGWIKGPGTYVLHSVIRANGELWCITPRPYDHNPSFLFIPDERLRAEMRKDRKQALGFRRGKVTVPSILYHDPDCLEVKVTLQLLKSNVPLDQMEDRVCEALFAAGALAKQ